MSVLSVEMTFLSFIAFSGWYAMHNDSIPVPKELVPVAV